MDDLIATDALAQASLFQWSLPPNVITRRINVAENVTYLVEGSGHQSILRLHRVGYHTRRAIACELAWSGALRQEGEVRTPAVIPGRDGEAIQRAGPHYAVMFEFVPGIHPVEDDDLTTSFEGLGALAARTHLHSMGWARPWPFERMSWDTNAVFGPDAIWGDWRAAPHMTPSRLAILERVETLVTRRLAVFGRGVDRYGLIHADMRLANLLIDGPTTRLIDFDDCGFGWFLYDFAAAISFMEDNPQIPALRAAWVGGYRSVRALSKEDESEIDSLVMLRRLALLAWIGSRIDAPEPQKYAPDFAHVSAELGEVYLSKMS